MLVMTTIFISKMEGLPPTSDIKMIDIWLILCQLVPFAQVVLLTIKENLREEEQEENLATKDNPEIDVEDGPSNSKEAWSIANMKPSKADSLTMLTMIGRVPVRFQFISEMILFQKRMCCP